MCISFLTALNKLLCKWFDFEWEELYSVAKHGSKTQSYKYTSSPQRKKKSQIDILELHHLFPNSASVFYICSSRHSNRKHKAALLHWNIALRCRNGVLTWRWSPFSSATTKRALKALAFLTCIWAGAWSIVNRQTLVTKAFLSIPISNSDVILIAATIPAKHMLIANPVSKCIGDSDCIFSRIKPISL